MRKPVLTMDKRPIPGRVRCRIAVLPTLRDLAVCPRAHICFGVLWTLPESAAVSPSVRHRTVLSVNFAGTPHRHSVSPHQFRRSADLAGRGLEIDGSALILGCTRSTARGS
jgi:hypothetical protein